MPFPDLVPIDIAIWRIGHYHRHAVHRRLESLGLYRGQHRLISILGETDGLTHSELSSLMNVSNATISKMVQRMEQTGFVERRTDEKDQRISRVFLTEKGRQVDEKIKQMFLQLQEDEIEGFNEEEIERLMDYLQRIAKNLDKKNHNHTNNQLAKEEQE